MLLPILAWIAAEAGQAAVKTRGNRSIWYPFVPLWPELSPSIAWMRGRPDKLAQDPPCL